MKFYIFSIIPMTSPQPTAPRSASNNWEEFLKKQQQKTSLKNKSRDNLTLNCTPVQPTLSLS